MIDAVPPLFAVYEPALLAIADAYIQRARAERCKPLEFQLGPDMWGDICVWSDDICFHTSLSTYTVRGRRSWPKGLTMRGLPVKRKKSPGLAMSTDRPV